MYLQPTFITEFINRTHLFSFVSHNSFFSQHTLTKTSGCALLEGGVPVGMWRCQATIDRDKAGDVSRTRQVER